MDAGAPAGRLLRERCLSTGKYFGEAFSDISLHGARSLGSSWAVAGQLDAPHAGSTATARSLGRES